MRSRSRCFKRRYPLVFASEPRRLVEHAKARFGDRSAGRDIAILTIGTIVAQGMTIASTPVLSRLYAPEDFGLLAVFLAVASVAATIFTLRYETAILVPDGNREAATIFLLSIGLALAGALLFCIPSVFLPETSRAALGVDALRGWFSAAIAVAFASAALATSQQWLNRQRYYSKMAQLRVLQSAGIACLAVLFGYLPGFSHGLLLAQTAAVFCTAILAFWFVRKVALAWQPDQLFVTARTHKAAPKYLLPTAILDVATLQMPVVLIAAWFTESAAGQFSMAWRLLLLPLSLMGAAVGQVFLQRFAISRSNPAVAKRLLEKTWLFLFLLGIVPVTAVYFFGDVIFPFFLGRSWVESGRFAAILAPMAMAIIVSSPTSGSYILLGLQRYSLYFGISVALYRPACIYVGYRANDLSLALRLWVVCEIVQVSIYQFIAWRRTGRV